MKPPTTHYIFGYGSLICSKSRAVSAPTLSNALPVRIHNVARTWNKRSRSSHATYLGVCGEAPYSSCVGVLIPLHNSSEELQQLDKREVGYARHPIPTEWVERCDELLAFCNGDDVYDGSFLDSTAQQQQQQAPHIWMYVPKKSEAANAHHPILQSYVDICVRGCLSISNDFLEEFLASTIGWDPAEMERFLEEERVVVTVTVTGGNGSYQRRSSSSSMSLEDNNNHNNNNTPIMATSTRHTHARMVSDLPEDDDDDDEDMNDADADSNKGFPNNASWIDDRHDPLYMRYDKDYSHKHGKRIDGLLQQSFGCSIKALRIQRGKKQLKSFKKQQSGGGGSSIERME